MKDILTTDDLNNGLPWTACPKCSHDCYGKVPTRHCLECGWKEQESMSDAERTMREEKWMLTDELFMVDEEAPAVAAFRTLQDGDWTQFVMSVENNSAMRFFNPELRDFSSAHDWRVLCKYRGIAPYRKELAIPQSLPVAAQDFCRELRCDTRMFENEDTGGNVAFHDPNDGVYMGSIDCVLVVVHEPDTALYPYFNYDGGKVSRVEELLKPRGLSMERMNRSITHIYKR